jgi:hypothetical protein
MAADACDAVTTGKMRILPSNQKRKWFDWLENIRCPQTHMKHEASS